jgi:hypothetical protein
MYTYIYRCSVSLALSVGPFEVMTGYIECVTCVICMGVCVIVCMCLFSLSQEGPLRCSLGNI